MNTLTACFRFRRWPLLGAIALSSFALPLRAALLEFNLFGRAGEGLSAANETGSIVGGTGGELGAGITFNDETKVLTLNVGWGSGNGFTDLTGNANNAHIHGPTAGDATNSFNQTAGVLIGLTGAPFTYNNNASAGGISGSTLLTPTQEAYLMAGRLYVNIHTVANGSGEMRGNLVPAPPLLGIDFNDRTGDIATNTQYGFSSFLIASNISATAVQTGAIARVIGAHAVTVSGAGANPGFDDRQRGTPTNNGALTQSQIYRDFIFSSDAGSGGLDVTVDGLAPNQAYLCTVWSFDQGSTGNRVSDWSANGSLVRDNYSFNGSTLPTNNAQYQFSFKVGASPSGQIALQGRRDSGSAAGAAVFLNALQLEITTPDAPTVTAQPVPVELYVGDNTSFTAAVVGTAPFAYQWWKDADPMPGATNAVFALSNAQPADAAAYSLVVSNLSGSDTSAPAALVVREVATLASGLIAYWPLDTLTDRTPDYSGWDQPLWATNVDGSNLAAGQRGQAVSFNGNDEFLTRTNGPGEALPAYAYPAYTVAMWVKGWYTNQADRRVWAEAANTNNNPLVSIGTDNAATNASVDIFIRNNNGGTPHNHRKSILPAFDGDWHHIAWVDNNGAARLYVDGVLDATDFSYSRGLLTPNIATLGAVYRTTNVAHFNGLIDDAAVWRRSLSQSEVQTVMASGPGVTIPPLAVQLSIQKSGGTISISFSSEAGRTYTLWQSDSLPGTFVNSGEASLAGTGGNVSFMVVPPGGVPSRFYRVRAD